MKYNNKEGKVTLICDGYIEIDGKRYITSSIHSQTRITLARLRVNDPVEFNDCNGEIIYIRNFGRIGENFKEYKGKSRYKYCEDTRDPDEVHDMEAVYGHDIGGDY